VPEGKGGNEPEGKPEGNPVGNPEGIPDGKPPQPEGTGADWEGPEGKEAEPEGSGNPLETAELEGSCLAKLTGWAMAVPTRARATKVLKAYIMLMMLLLGLWMDKYADGMTGEDYVMPTVACRIEWRTA
jgi:hypothetical protein